MVAELVIAQLRPIMTEPKETKLTLSTHSYADAMKLLEVTESYVRTKFKEYERCFPAYKHATK